MRAVSVPVTADVEDGFDDVAATAAAVAGLGVAGINIEDAWHGGPAPLRTVEDQCERLRSVRRAGAGLFINARIDTYLRGGGDLAETVERAAAYLAAGADGIFVPGPADAATIGALVEAIAAPLNVLVGPGSPSVPGAGRAGCRPGQPGLLGSPRRHTPSPAARPWRPSPPAPTRR